MPIDPKVSRDEFVKRMPAQVEQMLGEVADAVNEAPAGKVIAGSEEPVRDLFAELRRHAFETAIQMRTDAAEAAFPPSGGPEQRTDEAE